MKSDRRIRIKFSSFRELLYELLRYSPIPIIRRAIIKDALKDYSSANTEGLYSMLMLLRICLKDTKHQAHELKSLFEYCMNYKNLDIQRKASEIIFLAFLQEYQQLLQNKLERTKSEILAEEISSYLGWFKNIKSIKFSKHGTVEHITL